MLRAHWGKSELDTWRRSLVPAGTRADTGPRSILYSYGLARTDRARVRRRLPERSAEHALLKVPRAALGVDEAQPRRPVGVGRGSDGVKRERHVAHDVDVGRERRGGVDEHTASALALGLASGSHRREGVFAAGVPAGGWRRRGGVVGVDVRRLPCGCLLGQAAVAEGRVRASARVQEQVGCRRLRGRPVAEVPPAVAEHPRRDRVVEDAALAPVEDLGEVAQLPIVDYVGARRCVGVPHRPPGHVRERRDQQLLAIAGVVTACAAPHAHEVAHGPREEGVVEAADV